ncbi:MAG: hypothetical protein KAG61_11790, partial [Bacteriovoracaceae bacterium]|nr:hypothetical protein [Bacteriovoracaceae bacterium]
MGLFIREIEKDGKRTVPVWFMRQAGRYHHHYQNLKKDNDFTTLCKTPKLACEVTMGPIRDFGFDAAILFSDLLFPLEQMGLGLSYATGRPTLDKKLLTLDDVKGLELIEEASKFYSFQKEATLLLRKELPKDKNLIGFVGAPFTLFAYGALGTHAGSLVEAKTGLYDGRFENFLEILMPNLLKEMSMQVEGGADTISIFDTAVGELSLYDFKRFIVPTLKSITKQFKSLHPKCKIIYYSKHTTLNHLNSIEDSNIDVLGVDYRHTLSEVVHQLGSDYILQGNFDPCWLHLSKPHLEERLNYF